MGLRKTTSLLLLLLLLAACGSLSGPYVETFDEAGSWGIGSDIDAEGTVVNGRYEFLVESNLGLFWSTAGRNFADGIYEVEATQLAGPLDNGYGMLFRVDEETNSFYIFEVSGDGYVWIGSCTNGCEEEETLIEDGWFASDAVNEGLNATNHLRVRAEGANMIFSVNDQEVGRVSEQSFDEGDIGIMVETLGEGDVLVAFDNFRVTRLE